MTQTMNFKVALTGPGKDAALIALLRAGRHVDVWRPGGGTGIEEEWRVGRFRGREWCRFSRPEPGAGWTATFGADFSWPGVLENTFLDVVARGEGCAWEQPPGWVELRARDRSPVVRWGPRSPTAFAVRWVGGAVGLAVSLVALALGILYRDFSNAERLGQKGPHDDPT